MYLIVLVSLIPFTESAVTAATDPIVTTDRRSFILPIRFADGSKELVKEVRLFVSHNKGKTWVLTGSIDPATAREFFYRVPEAGEYWFLVQTVSKDGKKNPEKAVGEPPHLKVRVRSKDGTSQKGDQSSRDEINRLRAGLKHLEGKSAELEARKKAQ